MSERRMNLRLVYQWLSAVLLFFLWRSVFQQFFGAMLPRLTHLGAAGLRINDRPCECPQCDFSGFWPAGLLARAHRLDVLFNPDAFLAFRHAVFSPAAESVRWFYPPPTLLPVAAISYLPFEAAFWAWSALMVLASAAMLRRAGLSYAVIGLALLSPAALWNFEMGQMGTVMGCLLVGGLLAVETAQREGGALLGLLVIKPQYGILVPFFLAARGRWLGLLAGGLVAGGIVALTTALFGFGVWQAYAHLGVAVSRAVLEAPPNGCNYEKFGVSVFWMLRSFGVGLSFAYFWQTMAIIFALGFGLFTWRRGGLTPVDRMARTVFLSLLATPYGYSDDMVAWSVALAALTERRAWRLGVFDALFWLWPMLCPVIAARTGLVLTPLVVMMALAREEVLGHTA